MSIVDDPYPGATAPPEAVAGLAGSYRAAAHLLAAHGDATAATGRAPWRLAAIHAVELYLNAYLRLHGRSPAEIRGLHHDMAKYSALAASCGLQFRAKTLAHLVSLGETRAYVVTRYDPARSAGMEPPNRVLATLDEVATKVERALAQATARRAAEQAKTRQAAAKGKQPPAVASGVEATPAPAREAVAAPTAGSASKTLATASRPKASAGSAPVPAGKSKRKAGPPGTRPAAASGERGGAKPTPLSARAPSPTSG